MLPGLKTKKQKEKENKGIVQVEADFLSRYIIMYCVGHQSLCLVYYQLSYCFLWKEGNISFNNTLNTFEYGYNYGIRHIVNDHSYSERGTPMLHCIRYEPGNMKTIVLGFFSFSFVKDHFKILATE